MDIRALKPSDIVHIRKIFNQFYAKDVEFPDYLTNFLCAYVVEDSNKRIITAGGIRAIPEVCLVTDLNISPVTRVRALLQVLDASKDLTRSFNFDWLHAITDDPNWANQMKKYGFVSRGENLEIQIGGVVK